MTNPWGLTELQAEAMDARVVTEFVEDAAELLKVPPSTIHERCRLAREKIGFKGPTRYLIEWALWSRARPSEGAV